MKPHRFALDNPWAVLVGALLITVLGSRAFFLMPTEYFPDTNPPQVAVVTVEPGATAVDVARRITEIVEKELASINGLKKVSSTSRDEVSAVNAEFLYEKPIGEAVVDVQNAISRIRAELPRDILEPRIYRITDATRPIVTLALTPRPGSPLDLAQVRLLAENDIKDHLLNLPGVADVDVFGAHQLQINVRLDRDRLRAYALTPDAVVSAIKNQNITAPAGLIQGPRGEALVKAVGEFRDLRDLEEMVVQQTNNATIRLKDVAAIELGVRDPRSIYHGNGRPAIAVNVLRAEGGNVISAIRSVKQDLPRMAALWPDLEFDLTNDQQPLIDRNTSGMRGSLYAAIGLTVVIIFLFLADLRASLIAMVSIPLSFLFGLAALGYTGYTLNVVTLSGLIIATGMVVDATVVVVENIDRHQRGCAGAAKGCVEEAVSEILTSITAGLLTTVVMLIPIMFAGGYVEKVLRQFTVTLCLALVGSLLVAVLVVPPLALRLLKPDQEKRNVLERAAARVSRLNDRLAETYVRLLQIGLRHRALTMIVVLLIFLATVRLVTPIMGRELMPPMDTGIMNVTFELPPNAGIARMEQTLTEVEAIIRSEPIVLMISSMVGSEPGEISFGAGGQTAQQALLVVNLTTRDQRRRSIWDIADDWRRAISAIPELRSLQIHEYGASPMSTSKAPIDLLVSGRDPRVLSSLSGKLLERLDGQPGLLDLTRSWWLDKPEVMVRPDPRMARLYGTSPGTIASELQLAVGGQPVSGLRLTGFLDVPIRVDYAERWVSTVEALSELDIHTPGGPVPLRTLAGIETVPGQTAITRENLQNTIDITGYNRARRISQVLDGIQERLGGVPLPGGYSLSYSGTAAEMADSMPRVMKAVMLGMVLLLVLLMGVFRSFILPLPILVAIPLALIGSLWGLLITNKPMCMPAMMGILLLAGIVINNSIFLIDFIQQALHDGMAQNEAMEQAVRLRLRPVLMTTISTIVGMLPMILETAVGLERMSPLATAAAFGLLVGTVMTLVITPVTFTLLTDAGNLARRLLKH